MVAIGRERAGTSVLDDFDEPLELEAAELGRPSAVEVVLRAVGGIMRVGGRMVELGVLEGAPGFKDIVEGLEGPAILLRETLAGTVGSEEGPGTKVVAGTSPDDLGVGRFSAVVDGGDARVGSADLVVPSRR